MGVKGMTRRLFLKTLGAFAFFGGEKGKAKDEGDFFPLFNGRDLTGFVPFLDPRVKGAEPEKTWRVENGILICRGFPNGYLRTERVFKNFVLRFEYRMLRPGNSGVFLMQLPDRIWPYGVEFQLLYREVGRIFGVSGGRVRGGHVLQKTAKPVGEWNTYEIVHNDGFVATALNGHIVAIGCDARPQKGHLMFQSEGTEIHFRDIRIRELP